MTEATAEKMMESGIAPLELVKYSVLSCRDNSPQGTFTELRINSLELGALYPAQYRVVTNRNSQSLRLSTWAFRRVLPTLSEREGWTSFYIPAKALMRGHLKKLLENERKKGVTDFNGLVAELSSEILYEDAEQAAAKMRELRDEYGIRFLLSEFGDEYCPVLRLPSYPVDFVLLDSSLGNEEDLKASSAAASVGLAKRCGIKVIARINRPVSGDAAPDCYMSERGDG
ncbi:MAG: EAL domain-containing protein [Acutalibacteraceae bacterium]